MHYNYFLCQELFSFFSKLFPSFHSLWFFALLLMVEESVGQAQKNTRSPRMGTFVRT